mmetsp:Transcript_10481/g.15746  ORF Transcript_10481/g.15746 Transcript_10481/m.15746 type:complete len:95 (-) Transcript_10481:281-565(-)
MSLSADERAAIAAAELMATCKTIERRKTADDATTKGRISIHFGNSKTGTILPDSLGFVFDPIFFPSALGNLPARTPKKHNAAIHSATVVAIPAP